MVLLKNVSKDEVLGIQEEDKTVVFQKFAQNDNKQIWIKRKENSKGYFTLKNVSADMILTATSGYGLKIDVDGMYVKCRRNCVYITTYILTYTVVLFGAGNQGNHQHFDTSLLTYIC